MTIEEAAAAVIGALKQVGIAHMIVGGLSSNFYGIPRNTKDADVVIALLNREALGALASRLAEPCALDPQVTFETRWARPRDLEDAKDVMAVQADALDHEYITKWCSELKIVDRYEALRASLTDQ
jgi:hypothetical protein